MSLTRWFRKNTKKLMFGVLAIAIVGFLLGPILRQIGYGQRQGAPKRTIANYGESGKISNRDWNEASQKLEILKMLQVPVLLRSIPLPALKVPDLQPTFLNQLLFSDQNPGPQAVDFIKQLRAVNNYIITDEQINDIYSEGMQSYLAWLLLTREAQDSGIMVSNSDAGLALSQMIPQIFQGATYQQVAGAIITRIGASEEYILETFAELLGILEYAKYICAGETVTNRQLAKLVSYDQETMDIEFLRVDAEAFKDEQAGPTSDAIKMHFEKYKDYFEGNVIEENPYGFGYKLLDRAGLEYLAVKLDDIKAVVAVPTQEELEDFYQKNRSSFMTESALDPNDPNSPSVETQQKFSEVASLIDRKLRQDKIEVKAERIIREAIAVTETQLTKDGTDPARLTSEQFKQLAGSYKAAAEQLSEKYGVKVYTGQTGMLNAADMQMDKYLGTLYLEGSTYNPIGLMQVVFAVDELGTSKLGPFDVSKPKMHQNIGPLKDISGKLVAVVRVDRAVKASPADNVTFSYSKKTLDVGEEKPAESETTHFVEDSVIEDLKRLSAMSTAKEKAENIVTMVKADGWDKAIEKANALYPNANFQLESKPSQTRMLSSVLESQAIQSSSNPLGQLLSSRSKGQSQLMEDLYSLIPADMGGLEKVPVIVEFKPGKTYYIIKKLSLNRMDTRKYEQSKAGYAYKTELIESQSLAAVHFNPKNILSRMNFQWVEQDEFSDSNSIAN